MIMKKVLLLCFCLMIFCVGKVGMAMEQQTVAFIVQDYTEEMEPADYRSWKQVTRWAYRFPYFEIKEGEDVEAARQFLSATSVDKALLDKALDMLKTEIVVLVRVYDLQEQMDYRMHSSENGPLVKVSAEADLLVYRRDKDKILVDEVRESGVYDLGNYEKPAETIKWRLCDLVNTMEGRELIR